MSSYDAWISSSLTTIRRPIVVTVIYPPTYLHPKPVSSPKVSNR